MELILFLEFMDSGSFSEIGPFLLDENGFYILDENGNKIKLEG